MKLRRSLLRDQVTVATYDGEGAYGVSYAAERTMRCNVSAGRKLVRNAAGDETVAEATIVLQPAARDIATDELVDTAAAFAPESRVTVAGRTSQVIGVKPHTERGKTVFVEVTVT